MQRFSIFHSASEKALKDWHRPYADLFVGHAPVLDVGCGPGYFADLLRERSVECIGLDIDPAMVSASEARGHVAHQGDQRSLNRLGVRLGGIHISHVIEHLWGDDVVELFEQCAANLNEGGRIIIRTPNWQTTQVRHHNFWLDHTHRRPYPIELITKLLTEIGFTTETAGWEPYGLRDVFVIATKGAAGKRNAQPDFSFDPFTGALTRKRFRQRLPGWIKGPLRALRRLLR